MKFLLFGGARDTGKTEIIYRLANFLTQRGYTIEAGEIPIEIKDFKCVLKGKKGTVLIHSYTDDVKSIKALCDFYGINVTVNIVITSIRNQGDYMRWRLIKDFPIDFENDTFVEIPLGKVVRGEMRRENIKWYLRAVEMLSQRIVLAPPFEL
ncbi:MAG: hypothetical protein ACWA41_12770 [Putridiphycobacter sp.]